MMERQVIEGVSLTPRRVAAKRTIVAAGLIYAAGTIMAGVAIASGVDGTGAVGTCPVIGSVKIKPALVTGGTSPTNLKVKAKTSGACTGTRSGDGANVATFKAKGTGTSMTNNCTNLVGTTTSNVTLAIKWKVTAGSPKLNPSTAMFTMQTGGVAGNGNGTFDLSGTITAGSFNGSNVTAHIETDSTASSLLGECSMKGIKKITFGLNGASNTTM
jgi:hypothetical protein